MVINPGKLCISPPQRGVLKVLEQSLCFCDVRVNSGQYLKKWSSVAEGQVLLQSVLEKTKIFFHEWSLKKNKKQSPGRAENKLHMSQSNQHMTTHVSIVFWHMLYCCYRRTRLPVQSRRKKEKKKQHQGHPRIPGSQDITSNNGRWWHFYGDKKGRIRNLSTFNHKIHGGL